MSALSTQQSTAPDSSNGTALAVTTSPPPSAVRTSVRHAESESYKQEAQRLVRNIQNSLYEPGSEEPRQEVGSLTTPNELRDRLSVLTWRWSELKYGKKDEVDSPPLDDGKRFLPSIESVLEKGMQAEKLDKILQATQKDFEDAHEFRRKWKLALLAERDGLISSQTGQ